jgi:hypothetical protein
MKAWRGGVGKAEMAGMGFRESRLFPHATGSLRGLLP